MPQVVVTINGHGYSIACDEGQEGRIGQLGQYIDGKIGAFLKNVGPAGQVGENRLLVMASLVIADELAEATEALRRERHQPRGSVAAERDAATEAVVAAGIESLAARIEAVAERLETTT